MHAQRSAATARTMWKFSVLAFGLAVAMIALWPTIIRASGPASHLDAVQLAEASATANHGIDLAVTRAAAPVRMPGRVRHVIAVMNHGDRDVANVQASYQCVDSRAATGQAIMAPHELSLGPLAPGEAGTYIIDCAYSFWSPTESLHLALVGGGDPILANNSVEIGHLDK